MTGLFLTCVTILSQVALNRTAKTLGDIQYFRTHARSSLDSYDFKSTLLSFFASDATASKLLTEDVDWDQWFYAPGFPPKPDFDTSLVDVCFVLADRWKSRHENRDDDKHAFRPSKQDIEGWSANQVVVFLERVHEFPQALEKEGVQLMGETYGFAKSQNVEVVSRFFRIGLRAKYAGVYEPTAELLGKVGRMKFVRPLFRDLDKVDHDLAVRTFEENRDFYHPICRAMVEKDLYGAK